MPSKGRLREKESVLEETSPELHYIGTRTHYNNAGKVVLVENIPNGRYGQTTRSRVYQRTRDQVNTASHGGLYLTGGNFASYKAQLNDAQKHPFAISSRGYIHPGKPAGTWADYSTYICNPSFGFDPTPSSSYEKIGPDEGSWDGGVSSVDGYDTLAWARTRPKLEKGGAGVALAELRDLPRMLKTSASFFASRFKEFKTSLHRRHRRSADRYKDDVVMPTEAANHFLNHHFGWVPFIKDLGSMFDAFEKSQEYIAQITRDNNRWIKRKRVLEKSVESVELGASPTIGCDPVMLTNFCIQRDFRGSPAYAYHINTAHTIDLVWAVGSFRYYRPEFDNSLPDYSGLVNQARQSLILHGVRVNPSNLYKIVPWTWLGDWFTNVGTVIDNASSTYEDSVVSRYLYVMKHTIKQVEHTTTFNLIPGARSFTWLRTVDVKQRKTSNSPYGFALRSELSARQLAILVALGINRAA